MASSTSLDPLSDDELEQLSEWLETRSPFDVDGLLGVLHAVAVAPSLLAPSVWLPIVLPNGFGQPADLDQRLHALFRLHGEVVSKINEGRVMIPAADDVEGCASFARGYAGGAELDPEWRDNRDHWTFASPVAYLGGRLDLVSEQTVEDIELNLAPDPGHILRRDLGGIVIAANESFKKVRQRALSEHATAPKAHATVPRAGRNDPCPCGSGNKYKRCCLRRHPQPAMR